MKPLYERLGGRHPIGVLVRNFYLSLRLDPLLGPIFEEHVQSWPEHFEILTDFWCMQTGGPAEYRGKLIHAHRPLRLEPGHYTRWLAQWRQSCRLHFPEIEAGEMITLAENLTRRMPGRTISRLSN